MHTRERHIALIVELTLILFRVRSTIFSRQYVQHVRTVLKSLRILYRRTPRSRSDNSTLRQGWCWNKSRVCQTGNISSQRQLFLDCVDRATKPSTAFASLREQPMHFNDNQTLGRSIHEGCNCCCHGEVWRQNAEAKMIVLGLHLVWLHRKATTFNGIGTTSAKLNILVAIRLHESDMVIPR